MANVFDFELRADDQVSDALKRIDDQVKNLVPQLDKTSEGLELGGQETKDGLSDINKLFNQLSRFAKDNVQFIGDMVPPLKNITGQTGNLGGLVGKMGLAGGAAYLAGKGISRMGGELSAAAQDAYSLQIAAENAGMSVQDFTRLSGAMRLLGTDSDSARQSVEGLYKTFNDALQGRNNAALAVMNQVHASIVRNADGTANVLETMKQLAAVIPKLSPQNQKTVADALGLDANGLQLLREGAHLKELLTKSDEVGLTVDPKINGQLVDLNRTLTEVSSSWDGLKNRFKQKLAGTLLSDGSVSDGIKGIGHVLQHPTDPVAWNEALGNLRGNDGDMMRRARKDKPYFDSLSSDDQLNLMTGQMNDALRQKLRVRYALGDQANQLQEDMRQASRPQEKAGAVDPGGVQNRYALSVANNNPWNLRYAGQNGAVPGRKNFAQFNTGEDGVAAADRQLMLYFSGQSKNVDHPLRTLSEIISKASPRSDGNDTPAMIRDASRELGVDPNAQLNLSDSRERARVLTALFNREGNNPYSTDRIQSIIESRQQPQPSQEPAANLPWTPPAMPAAVQQPAPVITPAQPSIVVAPRAGEAAASPQAAGPGVDELTRAFSDALKEHGLKMDLTLIDGKTGQRKSFTGTGSKVSAAMTFPG